ncbi:hypothetical protein [Stappia sp. BW2]|nr:hypothetical protein [Stappia sp. BW2]
MRKGFLIVSAALSAIVLAILFWGLLSEKDQPPAVNGAAVVEVQVLS